MVIYGTICYKQTFGIKNGSAENVNKNSSRRWNSSDSRSSPVSEWMDVVNTPPPAS